MAFTVVRSDGSIALASTSAAGYLRSAKLRMNSIPSIPGISKSVTMMSMGGSRSWIRSSASCPSPAENTYWAPRDSSWLATSHRWNPWSSTTRKRRSRDSLMDELLEIVGEPGHFPAERVVLGGHGVPVFGARCVFQALANVRQRQGAYRQ